MTQKNKAIANISISDSEDAFSHILTYAKRLEKFIENPKNPGWERKMQLEFFVKAVKKLERLSKQIEKKNGKG